MGIFYYSTAGFRLYYRAPAAPGAPGLFVKKPGKSPATELNPLTIGKTAGKGSGMKVACVEVTLGPAENILQKLYFDLGNKR